MDKYCTQIDNNGYVIATYLLSDEEIAKFEGILLPDIEPPKGVILVDRPLKPKWNGLRWVEGASQEEIDAFADTPKPPPTLEEQLADKDAQILKLKEEQFKMQQATTENAKSQQELIELLMDMGVI